LIHGQKIYDSAQKRKLCSHFDPNERNEMPFFLEKKILIFLKKKIQHFSTLSVKLQSMCENGFFFSK